jgi:predicted  nucleic acid-binding Zn-ribbon protein
MDAIITKFEEQLADLNTALRGAKAKLSQNETITSRLEGYVRMEETRMFEAGNEMAGAPQEDRPRLRKALHLEQSRLDCTRVSLQDAYDTEDTSRRQVRALQRDISKLHSQIVTAKDIALNG